MQQDNIIIEPMKASALMVVAEMPIESCVTKETRWAFVSALRGPDTVWHSIQSMKGLCWGCQAAGTLTHTQPEAIEGMSVDAIQLANQSDGKFHHNPYLGLLPLSVLWEHSIQLPHHDCLKLYS